VPMLTYISILCLEVRNPWDCIWHHWCLSHPVGAGILLDVNSSYYWAIFFHYLYHL